MVFTDSISIVCFTSFLVFVVQAIYVFLHISETLARKRSVFNISLLSKCDHMEPIYQPPSLVTYFLHPVYIGAKGDRDFRISDLVKNPVGTDI